MCPAPAKSQPEHAYSGFRQTLALPPLRKSKRAGDPEAAVSERHAAAYAARAPFCSCRPCRKSAARCAWLAAVKIARLSCFSTLSEWSK